jgi:uncharacterized protein
MYLSKNKLRQLQNYFCNQPAIQKVHLFGSFARGEATAQSDVDLLVVLNYDFLPTGMEYFQIWSEIEMLLKRKVDFVSEKNLSKRVQPFVEPEKILIYENHKGLIVRA